MSSRLRARFDVSFILWNVRATSPSVKSWEPPHGVLLGTAE
jgi:hypothetical protein